MPRTHAHVVVVCELRSAYYLVNMPRVNSMWRVRDVLVKNSTCYAYVNDSISIDMIIGNAGEERKRNAFFTLFFIFINQSLLL